MLIYIHAPFCASKCAYCAFHSQTLSGSVEDSPELQIYADGLLTEIAQAADLYAGARIESVFFGGGTPSLLPPSVVDAALNRIGKYFKLAERAEITIEANPESLRVRNQLGDYLKSGANRLSIGIQSLDDDMLRMLGRTHKARDGLQAVFAAREAGFSSVGVDLMWGLPGQSMRQWLQTLKDTVRLEPDHISSYCLTLEPGTPLERQCASGELALPPERDQGIMFMEGSAYLESKGFLQYEISNFAKMGFQSRHNLGYWEGADYLGFGPSATSTIGSRRWTNPVSLNAWIERTKQGADAIGAEILTPKSRALELVMLRLRTARGLRLKAYRDMTGRDFVKDHQRLIQALHENGLVKIRNGYFSLTRSGMLVSNSVIANLFERMDQSLDDCLLEGGKTIQQAEVPASAAIPVVFPRER